jgi:F-box and WD-40 domain protein 1/11
MLGQEDDLVERVRKSLHLGGHHEHHHQPVFFEHQPADNLDFEYSPNPGGEEKGKRRGSIREFIRRASSVVRTRRNSHSWTSTFPSVPESTPSTPTRWRKLRQAASFRHSRAGLGFDGPVDSCDTLAAPIPGYGSAPPVIPHNSGAAARATAAAQNVHLDRTRHFLDVEDPQADRESGVGIVVTVSNQSQYQDESINRVDFITALPIELAIHILSQLDHRSLTAAALVSRNWLKISSTSHVWREAFCREKSSTYAMSGPAIPGTGFGLPTVLPDRPWKEIYRVRHELEANWRGGKAKPVYLNGHLDSIYCVQFDE